MLAFRNDRFSPSGTDGSNPLSSRREFIANLVPRPSEAHAKPRSLAAHQQPRQPKAGGRGSARRYRRNWRTFVYTLRHFAAQGHIDALTELRRLKPVPDPWREQSLRAAAAIGLIGSRDYDPSQILGEAELNQLVKSKLDTWQAGVWEGKKGIAPLDIEGLFAPAERPQMPVYRIAVLQPALDRSLTAPRPSRRSAPGCCRR